MKFCECGCGSPSPLAPQTCKRFGWEQGKPLRFIRGHNGRKKILWKETPSGCWEWLLCRDRLGYGWKWNNGKHTPAHRFVYESFCGKIPDGKELDHLCKNRSCVNPKHLEAVTHTVNVRRGGNTKLTTEQAKEIRRIYDGKRWSQRKLAVKFGVVRRTIKFVLDGETWK
jgi:hypothetical protein